MHFIVEKNSQKSGENLTLDKGQQGNARINRARTQRRLKQVWRMRSALFALRLNELLGGDELILLAFLRA